MDALSLIHLHMQLECIGINDDGDMVQLPCTNPDVVYRLYIAQTEGSTHLWFRHDVPIEIRHQLEILPIDRLFTDHKKVEDILNPHLACNEIFTGRSYIFPNLDDSSMADDVIFLDENGTCVILCDGKVISSCGSSRENNFAGEAWVYTEPEFQNRGYAKLVTLAWAKRVQQAGKIPFYSHRLENKASEGLAKSLGLIQYIKDIGYA